VVVQKMFWNNHPVCAALVASRLFLIAQPSPPVQEGRFVA
jgi:hypothetical protein